MYDLPFLNVRNADALEDPAGLRLDIPRKFGLFHAVATVLIKVRVVLDLQAVQSTRRALRGVLPNEITDMICKHQVGTIVGSRAELRRKDAEDMARLIEMIKSQIRRLYGSVADSNPHMWPMLVGIRNQFLLGALAPSSVKDAFRVAIDN